MKKKIILLSILMLFPFPISGQPFRLDPGKPLTKNSNSNEVPFYASKVINYHQPVYMPGHGDYQNVLPLRIVPPPPAIQTRMIAKPSPLYTEFQVPIKKTINIIKYPQQVKNPTNKYRFPSTYNPYFGKKNPINVDHPLNKLYSYPNFEANPPFGVPYTSNGQRPLIEDLPVEINPENSELKKQTRILDGHEKIPATKTQTTQNKFPILPFVFDNFGTLSYEGIVTDPFADQTGPMGNLSPYLQNPNRILI